MGNAYSYIQPTWLYLLIAGAMIMIIVSLIFKFSSGQVSIKTPAQIMSRTSLYVCGTWLVSETILLAAFNKSPHSHYLIILWPLPVILATWLFTYAKKYLALNWSLFFTMLLISTLQIFSFYNTDKKPWDEFYPKYEKYYKNNPITEQIGSPSVGWPETLK